MQPVHYDYGKFHIQPVSGKHIVALCGRWMQENFKPNDKRHTTNKDLVTCKSCLKKLKQQEK
jgi:hypothetical protein